MAYEYLRLNKTRYRVWDSRDAMDGCPKCGEKLASYVRIEVQFGFIEHRITTFAYCHKCHHKYAWRETAKTPAYILYENLMLFRPHAELEF